MAATKTQALIRLRANPAVVRVSIRRSGEEWRVAVEERGTNIRAVSYSTAPEPATAMALRKAYLLGMRGLDLDMQWAYPHPQTIGRKTQNNGRKQ